MKLFSVKKRGAINRSSLLGQITFGFVIFLISGSAFTQIKSELNLVRELAKEMNQQQQEEEDKLFNAIPDMLDCSKMDWIKNCKTVVRYSKKFPTAPIRIIAKDGSEVIIQPGTPKAFVHSLLDPSAEAGDEVVDFMDTLMSRSKQSASFYKDRLLARGGLKSVPTIDEAEEALSSSKEDVDLDKIKISTFIASDCPYCKRQISILKKVKARYPTMDLTIYQLDNNPVMFDKLVTNNGFKGRILNPSELKKVQAQGIVRWPISWVDNKVVRKRRTLVGVKNVVNIEEAMIAMSKIEGVKK